MIDGKRLGREYKNTCIVEFVNEIDVERLLTVLERIDMISRIDADRFLMMSELVEGDILPGNFYDHMNNIAPEGCDFQIKYIYSVPDECGRIDKIITIGFFD